jgi:hypothetical protein
MLKIDYVGHLAVTMFTGALVLVPGMLAMLALPRSAFAAVNTVVLVAAFALMFAMQRRRVAALKLNSFWLWAWAVLVGAAAAASIYMHMHGLFR